MARLALCAALAAAALPGSYGTYTPVAGPPFVSAAASLGWPSSSDSGQR